MYSVMWSEHCSYKSSKRWLRTLHTTGPQVVCGPGENAGVVDVGDGPLKFRPSPTPTPEDDQPPYRPVPAPTETLGRTPPAPSGRPSIQRCVTSNQS